MRRLVAEAGLDGQVKIDSAGTGAYHVGSAPDPRSTAAAAARGTVLTGAARQVADDDFSRFDLLLCADRANARDLMSRAPDAAGAERVRLLREFDAVSRAAGELDVPDPYLGEDGFEAVLDLIERACAGLLEHVQRELARRPVRRSVGVVPPTA